MERIGSDDQQDILTLEERLSRRVIGQDEAISAITKALRRARAGLSDPTRPLGVFMLLGPSGVGKTELCKALSEALFGSEDALIRVDMSEYSEEGNRLPVDRLAARLRRLRRRRPTDGRGAETTLQRGAVR